MNGKNVENWIGNISKLQDGCIKAMQQLAGTMDNRPFMIPHWHHVNGSTETGGAGDSSHSHGVNIQTTNQETAEANILWENEQPVSSSNITSLISPFLSVAKGEVGNVKAIDSKLYVANTAMHNSAGSPYTELYALDAAGDTLMSYAGSHPTLKFVGEKYVMICYLQMVFMRAVDAKWAIALYSDNIQRGYDSVHNGGKSSI